MIVVLLLTVHILSNVVKFVTRTIRGNMATGGQDDRSSSMECECDSTASHYKPITPGLEPGISLRERSFEERYQKSKHSTPSKKEERKIILREEQHHSEQKHPTHSKKEVTKKVKPRKSRQDRLETFRNMPTPHNITPNILAKSGFVYSRTYKACVCDECRNEVKEWNIGDKPDDVKFHKLPCRFATSATEPIGPPARSESDDMEVAVTMGQINHSQNSPFQSIPVQTLASSTSNAQLATMPAVPIDAPCDVSMKSTTDGRLTPIDMLQSTLPQRHTTSSNRSSHRDHFQGASNAHRRPHSASLSSMVDQPATSHYAMPNPRPKYPDDPSVDVRKLDMRKANNRLATFERYWPSSSTFINIKLLASCGFFCLGQGDAVQCFACHQVISNWKRDDDPWRRHYECSPNCRFARGRHTPNIPLDRDLRNHSSQPSARGQRPTQRPQSSSPVQSSRGEAYVPSVEEIERTIWRNQYLCQNPYNAAMREELARLNTFNCPEFRNSTDLRASDQTLVQAGLYYLGTGHGDSTKCWYCGGGLRDYLPEDDPWVEHAKYFPACEHLLRERGPHWVNEITRRFPNEASAPLPAIAGQVAPNDHLGAAGNQMLTNAMQTNPVIDAIRMGFDEQLIRDAQRRQIETMGNFFQTSEELIDALLNPEAPPPLPQGSSFSFSGGNFVGPNLVNGRLVANGNGNIAGRLLINGVPIQDFMDGGNIEGDPAGGVVFNNNGNVVSGNLSEAANSDLDTCNSSSSAPVLTGTPEQQLETLKKEYGCKICYSNPVEVLFQPCGHVSSCVQCARQLNSCPICRKRITKKLRAFHS